MLFISHRGNTNGVNRALENKPEHILTLLKEGLDVEIDAWSIKKNFYLGHDEPKYPISEKFLKTGHLWIHAKNQEALLRLHKKTNCFYHNVDDVTLTSHNFMWVYPGKPLIKGCVALLFKDSKYTTNELKTCHAICSDDILKWKELLS